MKHIKITYRGWAGHFIGALNCRFRLNTLIEYGEQRIVVSTVGLMELNTGGFERIGFNRYYETMAFVAQLKDGFWDADATQEVSFKSKWSWDSIEDEALVNDGHMAVVDEIVSRLLSGENVSVNSECQASCDKSTLLKVKEALSGFGSYPAMVDKALQIINTELGQE